MPWVAQRRLDLDGTHHAEIGEVWPFEPPASMVQLGYIKWTDASAPMPKGYGAQEPEAVVVRHSAPVVDLPPPPMPAEQPTTIAPDLPASDAVEIPQVDETPKRKRKQRSRR